MQGVGQLVDLLLTTDAHTLAVSLHDVSGIEVYLLWFQLQVTAKVVIHLLHHSRPLGVTGVRLTLMHQDALDDTILLCLLGQCDQTLVGIVVISLQHSLHPSWSPFHITLDAIGKETFDVDTTNGHMDNANLDVLGQGLHHRTTKPVGRSQSRIRTAQGSNSLTPFAHLTATLRVVNGRHQQETRTRTLQILSLRFGSTFHVRLSETQEDVEILVYGSTRHCKRHCSQQECHQ